MMRSKRLKEKSRFDSIARVSRYSEPPNVDSIRHCAGVFSHFWLRGNCLERGPTEGVMTEILVEAFDDLTCVDGASDFCARLKERFPQITVVCSLFEDFVPERKFANVVLGHVLEHVESPKELLLRVRTDFLAKGGRVFASVPNARSLHRQLAVIMGILETEHSLNETDKHHGHRRIYDPETFRSEFLTAGYDIEHFGGYWLKPVSNAQISASWTPQMLNAAMKLGERYPDISAEIYVVATAK